VLEGVLAGSLVLSVDAVRQSSADNVTYVFYCPACLCRWDALAPFNDTAKTILPAAALPRQPAPARTNANMNTVWMFTLLRV
jgi:hypothetical protein